MTTTIITLDTLPPEIITLIADQILLDEHQVWRRSAAGLCHYSDEDDLHHSTIDPARGLPPAHSSSFWSFASVSRHFRSVLFTSRESKNITVKYDGLDHQKAGAIGARLLAKVTRLLLICPQIRKYSVSRSDGTFVPVYNPGTIFRGLGEILNPYYLLRKLEIKWQILPRDDPRIKAMEDCLKAPPVARPDFRFFRSCLMLAVSDLHINLGRSSGIHGNHDSEKPGYQLDLILQQFDLPALRNFHLSHRFAGNAVGFQESCSNIVSAVHIHHWPCLQTVQICFMAEHRFEEDTPRQIRDRPVWRPITQSILNHLATFKKPLQTDISIFWKLPAGVKSFVHSADGTAALREQIMPNQQSFSGFVMGLQGRAKTRPFSLRIYGKFDCKETEFSRLLQASYEPSDAEAPKMSGMTMLDQQASIHHEVSQIKMDEVLNSCLTENNTIVTTVVFRVRVPVDRAQREVFLRQHSLQWDQVDWNDDMEESEQARIAYLYSSDESSTEGHDDEQSGDNHVQQQSSNRGEGGRASTRGLQARFRARCTIVSLQIPSEAVIGAEAYNTWLAQHAFAPNDPIWTGVPGDDTDDLPIGTVLFMSVDRGNARHGSTLTRRFEPPHQTATVQVPFAMDNFGRIGGHTRHNARQRGNMDEIIERQVLHFHFGGNDAAGAN